MTSLRVHLLCARRESEDCDGLSAWPPVVAVKTSNCYTPGVDSCVLVFHEESSADELEASNSSLAGRPIVSMSLHAAGSYW